jgi:hypothetical protein
VAKQCLCLVTILTHTLVARPFTAFCYLVVFSVYSALINGEAYDNDPVLNENSDCGYKGIDNAELAVGAGMGISIAAFFLSILQAILYCCASYEATVIV